jgi:hypothetical protein
MSGSNSPGVPFSLVRGEEVALLLLLVPRCREGCLSTGLSSRPAR